MKKILGSLLDIRRGEIAITFLMFANYYLILVTYYFLKPARDSLFLVKVSPEQLPLVFILTALVTAPVTMIYARASRSLKLHHLISVTTIVIIINLFVLRWLVQINQPWVYYLFYTWVSIYGAITTSQFWLLSNAVFDAAQAKRIFALLGLGGILGAFTGGEVTSVIVKTLHVSTENLLFFCIGFLIVSILLVWVIWSLKADLETERAPFTRRHQRRQEKYTRTFRSIFRSRHLALTVGIIAMTMMVASFVDYQFKTISYEAFPTKEELTSFLGQFYGRLSLVSLLLQLVLTYRFIRWLGVGGAIMFLPISLMFGSTLMFIAPGLVAGVLLRGVDGSLKYSIDKTGRELLFLPVPLELKKRAKIFVDLFVDRWFRGLAGGLLLLFTLVLSFTVKQLSLVVMVLLVVWLVFVLLMRKEYVNSFRKALEKREIDLEDIRVPIGDTSTVNTLIVALGSANERQVAYALDMLTSVKDVELVWPVKPLLQHRSAEIRRKALEVLQLQGDASLADDVKKLLTDDDIEVRREAIHFLNLKSDVGAKENLKRFLEHSEPKIRHAAVACIAEYGDVEEKNLVKKQLMASILTGDSDESGKGRVQLAKFLGTLENPEYNKYLGQLLEDQSQEVVKEAIAGIGRRQLREYVPWLLDRLADKNYRTDTRAALATFGAGIVGTLSDYFNDRQVDIAMRAGIPRVLREIPQQQSVDVLTHSLQTVEPTLKYFVVKALNTLRVRHPNLKFNVRELEGVLISETKAHYEILQVLYLHGDLDDSPASKLLKRALEEKQRQNLERIFRLLGLVYPPRDIYHAYQGIISGRKALHANAIEFLDNLLRSDVKKYVFPILDDQSVEGVLRKGEEFFNVKLTSRENALAYLITGTDYWLRACAIYNTIGVDSPELLRLVKEAESDSELLVRETAQLVLTKKRGA